MIEFESTAMMIGQLGVRVSLIAYPIISIKKVRRASLSARSPWQPERATGGSVSVPPRLQCLPCQGARCPLLAEGAGAWAQAFLEEVEHELKCNSNFKGML